MKNQSLIVASLYFLVLGAGDAVVGLTNEDIEWWRIAIDLVFCMPMVLRFRYVNVVAGAIIACVFEYQLIDMICFVEMGNAGRNFDHVFFSSGPFLTFNIISLIGAVMLVILGMKKI